MRQNDSVRKIKKYKRMIIISLCIILFSTDIANIVTYYSECQITDVNCIRYQISIVIPCLILAIYSMLVLYHYHNKEEYGMFIEEK